MNPMNLQSIRLPIAGCLGFALLALATPASVSAQSGEPVTRAEYEKLLREVTELKAQLGKTETARVEQQKEAETTADEFEKELQATKSLAKIAQPGSSHFLVAGYGYAGFTSIKGENSTFSAGLAPIFLWRLNDRVLFEAEPEFDLSGSTTEIMLEYANVSYILNDFVTLKAGKFLTPFGQFPDRLHPAWINKLPDFPLPYREEGGLVPFSSVGFQVSGNVPVSGMNLVYAFYAANGPSLNRGDSEPAAVGTLTGTNTDDNNNKAVGGRLGLRPLAGLEFAYSFQNSRVNVDGGSRNALLQAVDLSYIRDSQSLRGVLDLRGEWVWSNVSRTTYDATGAAGFGPLSFDNRRNGGYAQAAYRPSKFESAWIRDFEFVVRRDLINQPDGPPESTDERRWTFGLNYWLNSSTALKASFESGRRTTDGVTDNTNGFRFQTVMGF